MKQAEISWEGDKGILRRYKQGKLDRYDLIQKIGERYRYFYGVTDDGIDGDWKRLLGTEDD